MSERAHSPGGRWARTAGIFRNIEDIFYVAIAIALALAGAALFAHAGYSFFSKLEEEPLAGSLLGLLDAMLLVFIVIELIHTIRAVIAEHVLKSEPFLTVGIVAAIRRLVVISAEVPRLVGTPEFKDAMLEMGILVLVVVGLSAAILLLRVKAGEVEP